MPPIDLDEPTLVDEDFDHIQAAKDDLADVAAQRLDYTATIAFAQANALVSIAQSLDAIAFEREADDVDLTELGLMVSAAAQAGSIHTVHGNDYYREG